MFRIISLSVAGFLVAVSLIALTSSRFFPLTGQTVDLREGKAVFQARCAGCHAVTENAAHKMGPNLAFIGRDGETRKNELSSVAYILESIVDPDAYSASSGEHMPADTIHGLEESSVRNLLAYVATLGARPDMRSILALEIEVNEGEQSYSRVPVELIEEGIQLYYGKFGCASCHSYYPDPGHDLFAPSLSRAGQLSESYIVESLRNPSADIAAGYQQAVVSLKDGIQIVGRISGEQESGLQMIVVNKHGHYEQLQINKDAIESLQRMPVSVMPTYSMSNKEEQAIVAFLKFLKNPEG